MKAIKDVDANKTFKVVVSNIFTVDPKNTTFTCKMTLSDGTSHFTSYTPKVPVVPFYNSSKPLIKKSVKFTRDIGTSGSLASFTFGILHT